MSYGDHRFGHQVLPGLCLRTMMKAREVLNSGIRNRKARVVTIGLLFLSSILTITLVVGYAADSAGVLSLHDTLKEHGQKVLTQVKIWTPPPLPLAQEKDPDSYYVENVRCSVNHTLALRGIESQWGSATMEMTRAFEGSGIRLRKVLRKIQKGQEVTIGVLGGSISAGHNLPEGGKNWAVVLEEILKEAYPNAKIRVVNGAVGATGTDYFSSCYDLHVPVTSDLFIVEAAVNDLVIETTTTDRLDALDYTENLVRSILNTRSDNAVMMLSLWTPGFTFNNGAQKHAVVSECYDVPRLSIRSFLNAYLDQNRDNVYDFFPEADLGHPTQMGHDMIAETVAHFLLRQSCRADVEYERMETLDLEDELLDENVHAVVPGFVGSRLNSTYDPWRIPSNRISQKVLQVPLPEIHRSCRSVNHLLDDGQPELQPVFNYGFFHVAAGDKHWWHSNMAGSKITFDNIMVHAGTISLYYQHSYPWMGYGKALCWYDDKEDEGVVMNATWDYVHIGGRRVIATGVPQGNHTVTCRVLDESDSLTNQAGQAWAKGANRQFGVIAVLSD